MARKFDAGDVEYYVSEINSLLNENTELAAEPISIPAEGITPETAEVLGANLQEIYFTLRKQADDAFDEKMKQQRYERGYADCDVWNLNGWFIETVRPMLQQLRNEHISSPGRLGKNYTNQEGLLVNDDCHDEWDGILDRLIFLLGEMDEDSCSKQNKYQDAWWKAHEDFEAKYGFGGEGLKSEEEKAREKAEGAKRFYFPSDEPGRDDVKELTNNWLEEEKALAEYRDRCKNEFFSLFSEYFWDLWD